MLQFFAYLLLLACTAAFAAKPNVVVLFSDDAGYADFGFQPSCAADIKGLTPNLDQLAKEGARFSNAYMSGSVCSPSRAGLMTGRYQQRFGYDNNLPPGTPSGLALDETFGAKRLQQLGYQTALIGKWHLGYPEAYHPNERGFDWFYGLLQGSRPYSVISKPSPHRVILDNRRPTPETGYVTDRFGDAACEFIQRNKERPFFLFVSFTTPHGPLQPKPEDLPRVAKIEDQKRARYAGLIVSLDDNAGKVMRCLDATGLRDKTLVVFTNDNGGQTSTGANNAPLRGRKGTLYEGGIRVPWVMRWPGRIQPGSVIDEPVVARDLLPTLIAAADAQVEPDWQLDGTSLLPLFHETGETAEFAKRSLFWRQGGREGPRAMRLGHWKLVHERPAPAQLFDLSNDLSESADVSDHHPEQVRSMLAQMERWESQMQDPLWGRGAKERR